MSPQGVVPTGRRPVFLSIRTSQPDSYQVPGYEIDLRQFTQNDV